MCEAPLVRNALRVSEGISLRFPVSSAFMMAFVFLLLNSMLSIHPCMVFPTCSKKPPEVGSRVRSVSSQTACVQNPEENPIKQRKTMFHGLVSLFFLMRHKLSNMNVVSINIDVPAAK